MFTTRGRVFVTTKREDGTPYWREHGKGPIKINVHKETKRARIGEHAASPFLSLSRFSICSLCGFLLLTDDTVMRTDGTFQLKVNMRIFSEMGLKQLNDTSTFVSGFEGDMEPVSYLIKVRVHLSGLSLPLC